MNKLAIKKSKSKDHAGKEDAIKSIMREDDYLDGPIFKARVDLDRRLHKAVKNLASITESVEHLEDGEVKVLSVSMRMLLTEFLLDGLGKYEAGKGKYQFEEGEELNWKK